jgi:hypothetical protein
MQAGLERFSLGRRRVLQGLAGNRLNGCERVLDSMPAIIEQQFLGLLSTAALEAEAELARNRHGENHLSFGERVRGLVVGHEFADELALFGQLDERESRYSAVTVALSEGSRLVASMSPIAIGCGSLVPSLSEEGNHCFQRN